MTTLVNREWYAKATLVSHALMSLRIRQGLTQKEVAERSNTSQAHISAIERGKNYMSLAVLLRTVNAMDVDMSITFTPRNGGQPTTVIVL